MDIKEVKRLTDEGMKGIPPTRIPEFLQRPEFRFLKVLMWDKKPIEMGWTKTTNYTFDSEELKSWIAKGGNYGVSTGIGGLLVIDIDEVNRVHELGILEILDKSYPTKVVRTRSGGLHYYYICRDFDKKRIMYDLVRTEKEIVGTRETVVYLHLGEMQWIGQQIVGVSSRYREITETEVKIQVWKEENTLPIREVNAAEILHVFEGHVRYNKKLDTAPAIEEDVAGMEKAAKTRVGKITKKSTRFGPLKIGWLDRIKIADIIMPETITRSDPSGSGEIQGTHPLHGSDSGGNFSINVQKNVWRCWRCDSGGGVLELVAVMNGLIECGEAAPGCLRKEGVLAKVIDLLITKYGLSPNDIPYELRDGKAGDVKLSRVRRIVESVAEYHHIVTLAKSGKCYSYEMGVYKEVSDLYLSSLFLALGAGTISLRAECNQMLKACTLVDDEDVDADPYTICVDNGLVSIDPRTWEITLLPHDHNYVNMVKLPVSYVPDAKCPLIVEFIGDISSCAGNALTIEELFGYLIFRRHFIHKAFLFVGAGRNGKSTLLTLMRKFLGDVNVTSIPIQRLEDRFTPSELYGKLANISGDIPKEALKHTERFKEVTGEDFILMEKKYAHPFYMVNVAKQIFTGNQVPKTTDKTYGFFSRFIILQFVKRFDFEPGATKEPDPGLLERLTSPEEMSGLLNMALERLKDLMDNKRFTNALSVEGTSEFFEELSDPESVVEEFFTDMLTSQPGNYLSTSELNTIFQRWTGLHGYQDIYFGTFINILKVKYHLKARRKIIDEHFVSILDGLAYQPKAQEEAEVIRARARGE